VYFFYF